MSAHSPQWIIQKYWMRGSSCITMEFFNVFRGLKKSSSETKLGDRLSFGRKSKSTGGRKSSIDSPLPPRPGKGRGGVETTIIENITEDQLAGPSLHSPRRDTDQFGNIYNKYEPLVIRGNVRGERCKSGDIFWSLIFQTTPDHVPRLLPRPPAVPPADCRTTRPRGEFCWTVAAMRDVTSVYSLVRTAHSVWPVPWWPAPPCRWGPWSPGWCMAVSELLDLPPEYFRLLQWAGDPVSTGPVRARQVGDRTGSRDTTGDQTQSTLTISPCQVIVISSVCCPVRLYNKLTSSIALLRSQVLGSLPEHESLKLRSIWVLGSKNSALNGSHVFMLFS